MKALFLNRYWISRRTSSGESTLLGTVMPGPLHPSEPVSIVAAVFSFRRKNRGADDTNAPFLDFYLGHFIHELPQLIKFKKSV